MRIPLALLSVLGLSLACGGLFVSDEDRGTLAELVGSVGPAQAVPIFLLAGSQLGLVNARCSQCLEPYGKSSTEIRQAMGANALLEGSCLCPSSCATGVLEEVAVLEPVERMRRVAETCDAEGPDPLFAEGLEDLRPTVDVIDYAVLRMLVQPLEGSDELVDMHEALAIGLALRGSEWPQPTDELTVTGHDDPAPFRALAPKLEDCEDGLGHRLVVRPDGTVAGVDGPVCGKLLAELELPGDGWRVVDVAWSAAGIDAFLVSDEAPVEEPPVDTPKGGKSKAPGKKGGTMKMGSPTVQGSLDANLVKQVVRRHANQLRFCYQKALAANPSLGGTVTTAFVISADGNVASAQVSEGIDGAVDSCIEGRFRRMAFPKPSGGGMAKVTYSLVFSP